MLCKPSRTARKPTLQRLSFEPADPTSSTRQSRSQSRAAAEELTASWSTEAISHAVSFTGLAIACIVARVAEDGTVNQEDDLAVRNLLERQQGAWNMALVMDTLVMSMLLPLLLFEELEPPSNDLLSPDLADRMIWVTNTLVGFAFFITCLHVGLCSIAYIVTSYLTDTLDILCFFATFYRLISAMNVAILPVMVALGMVAALGNVLLYGTHRALPVIILFVVCLALLLGLFLFILIRMKARFRANHRMHLANRDATRASARCSVGGRTQPGPAMVQQASKMGAAMAADM